MEHVGKTEPHFRSIYFVVFSTHKKLIILIMTYQQMLILTMLKFPEVHNPGRILHRNNFQHSFSGM